MPVNSAAAIVTAGGTNGDRSWYEQRDDLRAAVARLLLKQKLSDHPGERLDLGARINTLNHELAELKKTKPQPIRDLGSWFMDVARERLSETEFHAMLHEAHRRSNNS